MRGDQQCQDPLPFISFPLVLLLLLLLVLLVLLPVHCSHPLKERIIKLVLGRNDGDLPYDVTGMSDDMMRGWVRQPRSSSFHCLDATLEI